MRGQLKAKKILAIGGALVGWLIGATPIDARDSVVVFNEVHYHPSGDEATEWIELHNQMAVDVDVSHWRLRGGVRFDFPADTVIAGGGFLVIAADPASLNGVEGGVYGPFEGALDNGGETLRLEDRSTLGTVPGGKARHRVMDELSYEDGDLWPIGADGSGATLAKIDPDGGTALVANWAASSQVGGTPGEANFPDGRRELSGLSFNEVDSAVADPFQLELKSSDGTDLSELCLRSSNPERLETTLEGILPAGGIGVVSENQLGYRPVEGERLFLIGKEGGELVDAIVVEEQPQGRDSAGLWRFEEIRTFGSENQIEIADSVVINEIMYRARPLHATAAIPGEFESTDLVDAGATWRFHSHGGAVPENWTTGLADWEIGRMPFGSGIDQAQPPLQTFLGLRSADNGYVGAFYFYQVFQVEADPALFHDLALRLWFDDGVAVYLNGTEIHRENLPEGMLTEKTSALDELDQPQWQDLEGISAGLLQEGVNVLAVEVHQKFTLFKQSEDVAFGAELAGRTAIKEPIPATSHRESETEWVELFNGGEESVDLVGWSLEDGARYEFPAGTTLPAGGYVVVDDLKGTLSNGGERLALIDAGGNTVDEVMYHDRGRWPREADGYGASLELRDPDADNRWAAAWAASDERGASEWQHYSYEGVAEEDGIGTQLYHELVVGMLDAGELLLDDVQVIEDPEGAAVEFMQNGDFEKGTVGGAPDHWLIVGTHGQSHLVEDPDEPGNQVLKVVTTGPTEDKHNQMSSVYAANRRVRIGETYRISFRAKWLSGSSLLNTRLYFNFLQRTTRVAMPETGGTPGRQNSAFENSGPIMDGLTQHPVLPVAEQEVEVRIQVTDADGIESVKLTYAVNGGSIFSGGTHVVDMEGEGSGPWYRGTIPGRKTGDLIRFFVTATDRMGRTAEFPPAGKDSRALYEVVEEASVGDPGVRPHRFRVLMEKMDREFLFEDVNHMSNDRISGTVIYKDIAYHNVGIRLKGSAWARNNTPFQGLNIRFDPEHPFRGVHETVALERDPGKGEILAHHLFYAAGGLLPSIYSDVVDLEFEQSSFSGRVLLLMARTSSPFLGGTFNNASEGTVYNLELLYTPQATVDRQPESLKRHFPYTHDKGRYDFRRMGPDKESYRWGFQIRSQRNRDHYEPLVRMAEALDLEGVRLAEAATQAMDVDQWARAFAMMALNGNDDFYTRLWEHNLRLYHRPEDDRMVALPWDFDRAWRLATSSPLIGGTNNAGAMVNLPKVLNRPENKRLFYGHLHDMLESVYNPEYVGRWAGHYGGLFRSNLNSVTNYVRSRANYARGQLPAERPFAITTNGGDGFSIDTAVVNLQGRGWVNVDRLRLAGGTEDLPLEWKDEVNWVTRVPVQMGENEVKLVAYDRHGVEVGAASITIVGTGNEIAANARDLILSEIHYHPAEPTADEREAGFDRAEAFEFLEIWNHSASEVQLEGSRFDDGVFLLLDVQSLSPGERAVVVADHEGFVARYGAAVRVLGQYEGRLANGGERVRWLDAGGEIIASVAYGDDDPWPTEADGGGPSLVFTGTPGEDSADEVSHWVASEASGGDPGLGGTGMDDLDYETWKASLGLVDDDADTDGDGLVTLQEYAFGTDPGKPSPNRLPVLRMDPDAPGLILTLYQRLGANDVESTIQTSSDLRIWSDESGFELLRSESAGEGLQRRVYRRSTVGAVPGFLRVRVVR